MIMEVMLNNDQKQKITDGILTKMKSMPVTFQWEEMVIKFRPGVVDFTILGKQETTIMESWDKIIGVLCK